MDNKKRFNIVNEHVEKYIQDTLKPLGGILGDIHKQAEKQGVPVAKLETLRTLGTILSIKKPEKVLELGCAVGLTSIFFSEYLPKSGFIDTVDNDADMIEQAKRNIEKAGKKEIINIIYADALDYLLNVDKKYDIIFIDAAKGHYQEYFDYSVNLLNACGMIIADNVLYKGMVAEYDKIPHRQNTIVQRLGSFLQRITKDPSFETSILSVGDGLSISVKK